MLFTKVGEDSYLMLYVELAIFFWIMHPSTFSSHFLTLSASSLAIFFWIMLTADTAWQNPCTCAFSCYFLLNYAWYTKTILKKKCIDKLDLLFSFEFCYWSWRTILSTLSPHLTLLFSFEFCKSSLPTPAPNHFLFYTCYFLLNFAHCLTISSMVSLGRSLAIFFWILFWKYYIPMLHQPYPLHLLFSFEFWSREEYCVYAYVTNVMTCYFLLNFVVCGNSNATKRSSR